MELLSSGSGYAEAHEAHGERRDHFNITDQQGSAASIGGLDDAGSPPRVP